MSRKANCYDNAMIESFWSTLTTESTARKHFKTRAEARLAVFDFIGKHTGNPIWDWRAAGTKVAGCLTRLF